MRRVLVTMAGALCAGGVAHADVSWTGPALYDRLCSPCHGQAGDGRGPARPWLWPPPRDLVRGPYKWSARPGAPTRDELRAVIDHGVRGTSMPGFAQVLPPQSRERLVDVVLGMVGAGASPVRPQRPALPLAPATSAAARARGAALWLDRGCSVCHGPAGKGDGPAAAGLRDATGAAAPPYDLTAGLRRPHDVRDPDALRHAAAHALAWGVPGTAMAPVALPADELWALAAHVAALAAPAQALPAGEIGPLAASAIAADVARPLPAATWPGAGEASALSLFGGPIAPPVPPVPPLAPAQASLSANQCGRCHPAQARAWRGSLHARAASPGLRAQYVPGATAKLSPHAIASCQSCHGPLPEQGPAPAPGVVVDEQLAAEGVTCAACHVRQTQRLGPPRRGPSTLPSYPLTEAAIYERSDFCLPCHQLPARGALAGRPLLDTYREWLLGPYAARGVQCQHCHMPDREHSFRGIHDPPSVAAALALRATAVRAGGEVSVRASAHNVGAGHFLPTTPTPAVWIEVELVDAAGRALSGSQRRARLGRHLELRRGALHQLEDTRLGPGQSRSWSWSIAGGASAVRARVRARVEPDEYYERFYAAQLAVERAPAARQLFERALVAARASHFVVLEQQVDIAAR